VVDTRTRTLFYGATPRIRPFSASPKDVELPGMEDDRTQMKRDSLPVTFADISRAHVSIRNGIKKTTCEKSYFLSELIGANIFLKTEFRQFTGSFKERGARNALLYHLRTKGDSFKTKGAIAASAGNHALGLAYHGKTWTCMME
jgi:threonine dehydratase